MRPFSVRGYWKIINSSFQPKAEYAEHEEKCTLLWDTPTTSGEKKTAVQTASEILLVTSLTSVIKPRNRPLCMMTLPLNNQNWILKSQLVTIIQAPKVMNILYIYYQLQKQATHSKHSAALLQSTWLASLRNVWTNPWRTTTPTHIYTVIQPTFLPPLVLRTSCMVAISFRLSP